MTPSRAWIRLKTGNRRIVVPTAIVRQVVRAEGVTPVPVTWPHVAGVLVVGREAVAVFRLALLPITAAPPGGPTSQEREIVIIEWAGIRAGILIEKADAMDRPPEEPDQVVDGETLLLAAGLLQPGADGQTAAQAAKGEI